MLKRANSGGEPGWSVPIVRQVPDTRPVRRAWSVATGIPEFRSPTTCLFSRNSIVSGTFRNPRRSVRSGSMKDQGEVHVGGATDLHLANVSPRRVVGSPQVDGVIAGRKREPIRLS